MCNVLVVVSVYRLNSAIMHVCANVSAIVVMSLCVHMCAWLIDVHAVCKISSDIFNT